MDLVGFNGFSCFLASVKAGDTPSIADESVQEPNFYQFSAIPTNILRHFSQNLKTPKLVVYLIAAELLHRGAT